MWDTEQRQRLAYEEQLIKHYMPHLRVYDRSGDTYIAGRTTTSGQHHEYKLRILLPSDYPYEEPDLLVDHTLWLKDRSQTINSMGISHNYHVLGSDESDSVRICHTEDWNASLTCLKVALKGILWLEAYEAHLRTGQPIADFLNAD